MLIKNIEIAYRFQRITLDREEKKKKLTIRDIDVYSMKGAACDFTFAYPPGSPYRETAQQWTDMWTARLLV